MKRLWIIMAAAGLLAAHVIAWVHPAGAAGTAAGDAAQVLIDLSPGFHVGSLRGYRGKVAEYEAPHDGPETAFFITGRNGDTAFNLRGDYRDRDDQMYRLQFAWGDSLLSRLGYSRFLHYLDHDSLDNQDFTADHDAGRSNGIVVEDMWSHNELRLPPLPSVSLLLDWRSYAKRGHRQATTVSGCIRCHVSSANRRVNSNLQDVTAGIRAAFGPATVTYTHRWRSFREHGAFEATTYHERNSINPVRSGQPYGSTADTRAGQHSLQLRSALPLESFVSAGIRWGGLKNLDTRHELAFNSLSALLAKRLTRHVSANAFYVKSHYRNKTPRGISRLRERGGFSLSARPAGAGFLKCTCQWQTTDRRNFDINTTDTQQYRLSYRQRLSPRLQLYGMYEKKHVSDQFLRRDPTYKKMVKTALPDDQDELKASATWAVRDDLSVSADLRYVSSTYRDYHVDESRWEYGMSWWWKPAERFSLTGAWACMDTDISTPASFSAWHDGQRGALLVTDTIPYDSRSMMYYGSFRYALSPRLFFNGRFTRVTSVAEFDARISGKNIGRYSDTKTGSVEYNIGMTYRHTKRVSFYAKYRYREYDDKQASRLDGRFDMVSLGVNLRL